MGMEPTRKSPQMESFLEDLMGRSTAIELELACIKPPFGCGRKLTQEEINSWDALSQKEYRMSGLCLDPCQNDAFAEPEGEQEVCTCEDPCCRVDVGIGIDVTCQSQHCQIHGGNSEGEAPF